MFRVTRRIDFCYGHRLLNYDGKCKNLHGHNGRAEIAIASETLDDLGMVLDFSEIKRVVTHWVEPASKRSGSCAASFSAAGRDESSLNIAL